MDSKNRTAPVRFGVMGPGRAAVRFAQGLAGVEGATLTGVWGRNAERARSFAERFAVPFSAASVDELLAAEIDAVYIATHADTHAELTCAALAGGKHVLCEKPAALNAAQVRHVTTLAREHGLLYMEAMKPPFFPLYQQLRAHLKQAPIGPVGFVRAGHCDARLAPDYPLHFPELGGGGIMGIGPYEAFLALDWLGPLKNMQVMGRLSAAGVDNFALFQTEHTRGMAQLHTGLDLLSRGDALMSGPLGYVAIHENWWNPTRATIVYTSGRTVELEAPFAHGGFNYETAHFCELLRAGATESPEISHALSIAMAELLEQARTALGVRFPGE
ncbi:MAG TPA: Gfo/Idh/MocA family oxidoreductase [Terracidiphilus sp.]